jgi:pimeloyl-ACP methyl ester carboxylesterase
VTVAKLRPAGAVILGKLSTWEFAIGGASFDLPWPPARNPWNIAVMRTPVTLRRSRRGCPPSHGWPSVERAAHLNAIDIPMLFLQSTRDCLAEIGLLASVVKRLKRANLSVVENGDHSFHVPARSGRTDQGVKGRCWMP